MFVEITVPSSANLPKRRFKFSNKVLVRPLDSEGKKGIGEIVSYSIIWHIKNPEFKKGSKIYYKKEKGFPLIRRPHSSIVNIKEEGAPIPVVHYDSFLTLEEYEELTIKKVEQLIAINKSDIIKIERI
jgi:hypothetical protein